jgi:hypothetical protein
MRRAAEIQAALEGAFREILAGAPLGDELRAKIKQLAARLIIMDQLLNRANEPTRPPE